MTETKNVVDHMWSPEDFEKFKTWLYVELNREIVTVNFTKRDGTDRSMRCTLDVMKIPRPVQEIVVENGEQSKPRKYNPDVRTVYDVDSKAWRSFRWDSVKSVNYEVNSK